MALHTALAWVKVKIDGSGYNGENKIGRAEICSPPLLCWFLGGECAPLPYCLTILFALEEVLDAAYAAHHVACLEGQIDRLGSGA